FKAVGLLGSKVSDRIVAPVVLEFLSRDWIEALRFIFVKFENRHQLDGGHSQVLEIRDLFSQPSEGSGTLCLRTGMDRQTANVCLVDDRIRGGMFWRRVPFPVKMVPRIDAFRCGAGVIKTRNA